METVEQLHTGPKQQIALPTDNELFKGLNKEQLEAVRHKEGPLLIVAGAGTGKTTVITRRIAHLVETRQARLDEIAALTFTEKAAGEMQERVDLLLPLGNFDSWIATFHGFCERLLKNHALDIGLPGDFELLSTTQAWILVHKNLDKFKLNYYKPLGNPSRFISALLTHFSRLKDEVITPEQYLEYAQSLRLAQDGPTKTKKKGKKEEPLEETVEESEIKRIEELANAYHVYQKLLIDKNFLDFGDLINYALDLFKKRPKILEFYQNKFKYVLVDEFQDTNYAQYELVKLLAGKRKNLTVVGDDDQSIYKFRGASVSNILKFKEDYPEFKQITLVENYRSTQNILDLAYDFIQANNPDRLEVKLNIDKRLKSNKEDEGTIAVLEAPDLQGELECVVGKILELKEKYQNSWNDFAILLRANSAAEDLLPLLYNASIPYTYVASRGLYKKPVIADLLSYLRLLDNAHDSSSLYKVLNLPKFHLSHEDLSHLLQYAHKKALSLHGALLQAAQAGVSVDGQAHVRLLLDILGKHAKLCKEKHAAEIFVNVVKDLGFEDRVKAETLEAAENRELIEQFFKKISEFEQQNTDKGMHNFLALLDLEQEAGNDGDIKFDPGSGPESLKVMTIHGSKGLEFENVFVINMVDQRFPTREKAEAIEIPEELVKEILPEGDFHKQEERRLFYVAVTRAKQRLYLTWAKDYGGARTKKPSEFLVDTGLVPSEKVNKATGVVVFDRPKKPGPQVYIPATQFSYSQLNDFEQCPLKYKYQHYLKLPVEGSCHLSFGQTIHKVFEEYLKLYKTNLELPQQDLFGKKGNAELPEFKFLEQLYEKNWVDDWYRDSKEKEEYRATGKKMLETFHNRLVSMGCKPKFIEQFFKIKIGSYDFVGKIDRADLGTGGLEIWDYKTGKVPKNKDKKDLDQLYIYQWAAQEFLQEKVTKLTYWFLKDDELKEEPVASPEDIENLRGRLFDLIERIVETTKHNRFAEEHKKCKDHKCEFEFLE